MIYLALTHDEVEAVEFALLQDLETVSNGLGEVKEWQQDKKVIERTLRKIEKRKSAALLDTYIDKPK